MIDKYHNVANFRHPDIMIRTSFKKTTHNEFRTLTNGVDDRLSIIRHELTGFYNISKMIKLVHTLKVEEAEASGSPRASIPLKSTKHWFDNQDTRELIQACGDANPQFDRVHYELKAGTPVQFAGTYVHHKLYDHFMMWLDRKYALRVSSILDKIHRESQEKLERALKEKDVIITDLRSEFAAFRAEANARLNEIIEQNKETHTQNRNLKATVDDQCLDIKQLIRVADNISIKKDNAISVVEDSYDQTCALSEVALRQHEHMQEMYQHPVLTPSNPSLVQGTAWFHRKNADRSIDIIVKVGQRRNVMAPLRYVGWKPLVEFKPYGSGINYRLAVKQALKQHITDLVETINQDLQRTINTCKGYIRAFEDLELSIANANNRKAKGIAAIALINEKIKNAASEAANWKANMGEYNQRIRNEYQERVNALKSEIREYNKTNSTKRSIRAEVAALDPPALIKTKKAWLELNDEMSLEFSKERHILVIDDTSYELAELTNKYNDVKEKSDNAHKFFANLPEIPKLTVDSVFTQSRFAVELADSQSISDQSDIETEVDAGITIHTISGFTWRNHQLLRFSKVREFLKSFDERSKTVPIEVDEELTSMHILEERIEYLKQADIEDDLEELTLKHLNVCFE